MNVKAKYLKDENGNTFSPVVDASSVYYGNNSIIEELFDRAVYSILYLGEIKAPSQLQGGTTNIITLTESINHYDTLLILEKGVCSCWWVSNTQIGWGDANGDIGLVFPSYSTWGDECVNFLCCNMHINSDGTQLYFAKSCYAKLDANGNYSTDKNYSNVRIKAIVGIQYGITMD